MSSTDPYLPTGPAAQPAGSTSWRPGDPIPSVPVPTAPQWASPTQPANGYSSAPQGFAPAGSYGSPAQTWSSVPTAAAPSSTGQEANPYGAPSYGTAAPGAAGYGAAPYGAPSYGAPAYGAPAYGAPAYGAPTYGAPAVGGPAYGSPQLGGSGYPAGPAYTAPPFGAPMYAPVPVQPAKNGMAVAAFVVSLVLLVVGFLSGFYIGSFAVVWMGIAGLRKASVLDAAGQGPKGRVLAWCGIGVAILNLVIVWTLKIAAI